VVTQIRMHDGFEKYANLLDSILSPYGGNRLSSRKLLAIQSRELSAARERNNGFALDNRDRLEQEREKFVAGWRIETEITYKEEIVELDLLITSGFPQIFPKVYIASPSTRPLELPHLERDGRLCVWKDSDRANTQDLVYVIELLRSAVKLVKEAVSGRLDHHFDEEFLSYWNYHCSNNQRIKSLCSPYTKRTREIVGFRASNRTYYADTQRELIAYLDNIGLLPSKEGANKSKRKGVIKRIFPSALFHFKRSWHPHQFPNSGRDLMSLIEDEESCEPEIMVRVLGKTLGNRQLSAIPILISFQTEKGPCLCSVVFARGLFSKKRNQATLDGFRNSMSLKDIRNRISGFKVYGNVVQRFDQSWCLGRDNNSSLEQIRDHKLVLIGCGSMGSTVARLLLQSGVKHLDLFDPDIMSSENVGRHELGIESVGLNKAKALAGQLRTSFPWVQIEAYDQDWQGAIINIPQASDALLAADLILSCTADWSSDLALINFQSDNETAPLVFGAVEAHALAAHAIVNTEGSCAFESLHYCEGRTVGNLLTPITDWGHRTIVQIPACAGEFQPYGAIELMAAHRLLCSVVMGLMFEQDEINGAHHVHIGSRKRLIELGGDWSSQWQKKWGDPEHGEKVISMQLIDNEWTLAAND